MSPTKNFRELQAKMSPERRARTEERVRVALLKDALQSAVDIIQRDRAALVECSTMPIGDLATLDKHCREALAEYDQCLSVARLALGHATT